MMRRLTERQLQDDKERARMRKKMQAEIRATDDRQFEDGIKALMNIPDEEWQAAVEEDALEMGAAPNAA